MKPQLSKFALCLLFVMLTIIGQGCNQTTEGFAQKFSTQVNKELNENPDNAVFKSVEFAHVSVKCKQGFVSNCVVETIDGSDFAGHNGSNVKYVLFHVTVYWDGIVHKDGHTVIEYVLDVPNDTTLSAQIIETDAYVNISDPQWWHDAGELLGAILTEVL